jgi:predicted HTH domain antitoxin
MGFFYLKHQSPCKKIKLAINKAAELAAVSRQEFLAALSRFKVSPFQVTPEELARETADA